MESVDDGPTVCVCVCMNNVNVHSNTYAFMCVGGFGLGSLLYLSLAIRCMVRLQQSQ